MLILLIVLIVILSPLALMYGLSVVSRSRKPIHLVRSLPEYSPDVPMVHSRSPNLSHYIAPMDYFDKDTVRKFCVEELNWKLARETEALMHFEVYSDYWRFVDDVHLEFDPLSKQIYLSSRSRVGKTDFGVNRKRLEQLRSLLEERAKPELR